MRAPPESLRPMTGAPTCTALSMILQIFSACASESEPPNTVKSWLNTKTSRPLMVPWPVTTPSPAIFCCSMPTSRQRCSTYMSHSSQEPSSTRPCRPSRVVGFAYHDSPPPGGGAAACPPRVAGLLLCLHAEVEAAVLDIHVRLLEGALGEQDLQALALGQLALGVLRLDALLAAADRRLRAHRLEPLKYVLHGAGFPALFLGPRFWQS